MKKKIFQWALTAAIAVALPMCVTSCSDKDDNPVTTEDEEDLPVVENIPTTDQLTVTSNKTLYILTDYQPDEATVGKDCIIRHLLARFSNKKMVTDEASVSGMQEGDYMLLYLENSATADNAELRAATRKFISQGGIVMFAETPAVDMETLLNHGTTESELPVMADEEDKGTDLVHVYFNPSYSPTFYHAKFDNFDTEQAEHITDYWLGKVADLVITGTEKWVEEARSSKFARALTRADVNSGDLTLSQNNRTIHQEVYGSYYFNNNDYANEKACLGGNTDYFQISVDVWACKSTDSEGKTFRLFYTEVYGNLSFGNACLGVKDGKDYAYTWKKGGHIYKVNEIWGKDYTWKMHVNGVSENNMEIVAHTPVTTEYSGSYSEGISYNLSGSMTLGVQGANGVATGTFGGGLSISSSTSTSWTDVSYEDMTGEEGKTHVGGKFNFRPCTAKYSFGSKGNVGVTMGASCARHTFTPKSAFLLRVNDDTSKVKLGFFYWVNLASYRAYDAGYAQGKMDIKGFQGSWDTIIDLSKINYSDEE